ncbi:hypothetical protein ABZ820_35425 [Streptomyces diacarni]|uniref:hypothetical protein n=1 Tax=Streptomyces diacarni TaxID=2800381 RepID=UPI0033DF6708
MNCKAVLAFVAREIRAARTRIRAARIRRRGIKGRGRSLAPVGKIRRRFRFVRWAVAVQLLKGAAYAGGGAVVQVLLARFLGG